MDSKQIIRMAKVFGIMIEVGLNNRERLKKVNLSEEDRANLESWFNTDDPGGWIFWRPGEAKQI